MAPVAKAPRRYFIELNGALILYIGAIVLRNRIAPEIADPILKDMLIASPVLPVLLMTAAIVRFFYRVDEYKRRQILESLAIATCVTCVFSVCWMFLSDLGLPNLSIFWTWPILAVFWALTQMYFKWRDKAAEGEGGKAVLMFLLNLAAIAAGTGLYAAVALSLGWPASWIVLAAVATVLIVLRAGYFIFTKKDPC